MTDDLPPRLIISAAQRDVLRERAEAAYPNEFCALLVGRDDDGGVCRVTRVVPAPNVHPEPRTGFEVDPRVLIETLRQLRQAEQSGEGTGERLVGHVHSHPDGPAVLSDRDRTQAFDPGQFWIVMAVHAGRLQATAGFQVIEGGASSIIFRTVPIAG